LDGGGGGKHALGAAKDKEMTERVQNKMKMKNDDFDLTTERQ